ncbi:MAG: RluA family pseudouridine synthase [Victivallales bacterium]|nr:RluA family pseudouridine synthase [Victivallales bacterium]
MQSPLEHFEVTPEEIGLRLDHFLVRHFPKRSRSFLQRCVEDRLVTVNGAPARPGLQLEDGQAVEIWGWRDETPEKIQAADIPLEILFEDDDLLVINKPAGLVVHPAAGNRQGTLVSALLHYAPETFMELADDGEDERPGIVHRLDKDTSGVMVIAKSPDAYTRLKKDFRNHQIDKIYLAIARGHFRDGFGVIDAPIGRDEKNRQKRKVVENGGKDALTKYRRVGEAHGCTLLQVRLYTGRTHQIRVHLAHMGHPVLGDLLYSGGAKCPPFRYHRQLLHAWKLALQHPRSGERMVFTAPPAPDMASEIARFADFCDLSVLEG